MKRLPYVNKLATPRVRKSAVYSEKECDQSVCDLQTIQDFYRDMKINGFGPHCNSGLSPRAGGVACLALWRALVRAVRKQLLTLPGRTLLKASFALKSFAA